MISVPVVVISVPVVVVSVPAVVITIPAVVIVVAVPIVIGTIRRAAMVIGVTVAGVILVHTNGSLTAEIRLALSGFLDASRSTSLIKIAADKAGVSE